MMHFRCPTPWYYGWNIIGICVLIQVASLGVATNCFTFFLESWSREFAMPVSELMLAIPLFSITCCFLAPIAGAVADKYPARTVLGTAMLGVVACHFVMGFITAGWQIIAAYMLLFPFAIVFASGIPTQTLVSRWFVRLRGLAFSICAVGLVTAGVFFPPLVVWLIGLVGWRFTWWIFGIVILLLVFTTIRLAIRERPDPIEGQHYVIEDDADARPDKMSIRQIISRRNFWVTIAVFAPVLLANSAMTMNFAPFVTSRGLTLAQAAVLIGVFNGAAMIGKLAVGILADRYGNRLPLILLAILGTVGTFWLSIATSYWALTMGFVALGASQGVWVLLASCIAFEFGSRGFPRAYGVANIFSVLTTFSPPAMAWAQEQSGSYTPAILALGAICLIAVCAAPFFDMRRVAHLP